MRVWDEAFQGLFRHLLVYNMLFEDTEVDDEFLEVDETSRVLGISGAGCGIAGHLIRQPRSIDAVDINARHLAITALKVSAARELKSYEEFYRLWGHGTHARPRVMADQLTARLPNWIRRHWLSGHKIFSRSFHRCGLTSQLFGLLRRLAGVDAAWMRRLIALPVPARASMILGRFEPVFRAPWVAALLRSPLNLVAIGVNGVQRDRMLRAEKLKDVVDYLLMHLVRVANTDLERNWFAWHAVTGDFNHERADAVPPFLRRDHHEASFGSKTKVQFHHRNIIDLLRAAEPHTWTHYTLCDAPDWMPPVVQKALLRETLRTSVDGAIFLHRSVEDSLLPESRGFGRHFRLMTSATETATRRDRTRQYRRVAFYRIEH
jgi:S-adenosylmethionine-diacylglycerol 3-amino-3-carboxypropyl transferase